MTERLRTVQDDVPVAGIGGGVDDGGADLHRLVDPHPRNLLDALRESLHRSRPQTRR
jgi:hypothetical protein